jgi:hypothetical protein
MQYKIYSDVVVGHSTHTPHIRRFIFTEEEARTFEREGLTSAHWGEVVGMQAVADTATAYVEKQMHTATQGVMQ